MIQGSLIHRGIRVPREMLHAAIHRVDHENTVQRQTSVISRRIYSTPYPNAVWHLDGKHKMVHWCLIIHAAVDGFSRCITYIKCSNNNCTNTVLEEFQCLAYQNTCIQIMVERIYEFGNTCCPYPISPHLL